MHQKPNRKETEEKVVDETWFLKVRETTKMAEGDIEQKIEKLNVQQESAEQEDDFVDPWTVTSQSDTGIDYDKLIRK